jgi:hypothetical protein
LREALQRMGRKELIGYRKSCLIPPRQPAGWEPKGPQRVASGVKPKRGPARGRFYTQYTGLPPSPGSTDRNSSK